MSTSEERSEGYVVCGGEKREIDSLVQRDEHAILKSKRADFGNIEAISQSQKGHLSEMGREMESLNIIKHVHLTQICLNNLTYSPPRKSESSPPVHFLSIPRSGSAVDLSVSKLQQPRSLDLFGIIFYVLLSSCIKHWH